MRRLVILPLFYSRSLFHLCGQFKYLLLCCFKVGLQVVDFVTLLEYCGIFCSHLRLCKDIYQLRSDAVQQIHSIYKGSFPMNCILSCNLVFIYDITLYITAQVAMIRSLCTDLIWWRLMIVSLGNTVPSFFALMMTSSISSEKQLGLSSEVVGATITVFAKL